MFYGDEYTLMSVTLGGAAGGLAKGTALNYYTDTDNAVATGPSGGIHSVPEPASLALLAGAAALFVMARRRRDVLTG